MGFLVAVHHQLMCSVDVVDSVEAKEIFRHVLSEDVASTSRTLVKATDLIVGVTPEKVAHGT